MNLPAGTLAICSKLGEHKMLTSKSRKAKAIVLTTVPPMRLVSASTRQHFPTPYFVDEMLRDDFSETRVELLAMLVEHHGVGVPVQLLKAQAAVVLPLDLLDGILQKVPDVVHIFFIHRHLG